MDFKITLYAALLVMGLGFVGCAAMEKFFTPGTDGKSNADKVADSLTGLPPPWNEIIPGAILTLQNGYLLFQRGKTAAATRKKRSGGSMPPSEVKLPA